VGGFFLLNMFLLWWQVTWRRCAWWHESNQQAAYLKDFWIAVFIL